MRRRPQLGPKRLPSHHHHGQRTPCSDQRRRATMSVDAPNGMHLTGSSHPITSGERPAGTIWLRTAVIARIAPTSFHTDEVRARCWVGLTASAPLLALPWLSPPRPPPPDWKGGIHLALQPHAAHAFQSQSAQRRSTRFAVNRPLPHWPRTDFPKRAGRVVGTHGPPRALNVPPPPVDTRKLLQSRSRTLTGHEVAVC